MEFSSEHQWGTSPTLSSRLSSGIKRHTNRQSIEQCIHGAGHFRDYSGVERSECSSDDLRLGGSELFSWADAGRDAADG